MVSTPNRHCAQCPDFHASDRIPNANLADSLQLAAALTAATYDESVPAALCDRLPPHQVTYDGATIQYICTDRNRATHSRAATSDRAWDVSIQAPYRRLLGQIELAPDRGGWIVINVDRTPFSDGKVYASYFEATIALRRLASNPIDRAGKSGRHLRVISAVLGGAIVASALLPLPAWAYRGAGRGVTEPPASQSQPYEPPDRGGPDGTGLRQRYAIGSGTR